MTAIMHAGLFDVLYLWSSSSRFIFVASRKAVEIVHRESLSLHPLILKSLDDIGRSQVRKLLERLQVKCLTSRDLIKHHIIPALQASQNSSVRKYFVCEF